MTTHKKSLIPECFGRSRQFLLYSKKNDISGSVQEKSELIGRKLVARHGIGIQIRF
jgi:hypothetical protein